MAKRYRSRLVSKKLKKGKDGLFHYTGQTRALSGWSNVSAKAAGMGGWNSSLHPRDSKGRFRRT